jgi:hypothetical protein
MLAKAEEKNWCYAINNIAADDADAADPSTNGDCSADKAVPLFLRTHAGCNISFNVVFNEHANMPVRRKLVAPLRLKVLVYAYSDMPTLASIRLLNRSQCVVTDVSTNYRIIPRQRMRHNKRSHLTTFDDRHAHRHFDPNLHAILAS